MAEIPPVGESILPLPPGSSRAGGEGVLLSMGLPLAEVPPLIEPITIGFDDPPAEIRPRLANRRPVRRRFLPPVSPPAGQRDRLPLVRTARPPMPPRQLAALAFAPTDLPLHRGEPSDPLPRAPHGPAATAAPVARRRRRLGLVAAGVAAALAIATAFEVGVSVESLRLLPGVVLRHLPGPALRPAALKPPADPARRIAYYTARANAGDAVAQVALAVLYAKGDGVRQDYATAASWFRRAAEQGVARAQYDLGVLCEHGRGVPIDYVQAAKWYRKAAQQNHPLAEYNLAVAYTKGEGVGRSLSDAAVWYHRAAARGVVAAMVNLAILYERGDGVEASTSDAYAWYRAASQRGSAPAARRAEELLRGFSPWEQTRAEAKTTDVAASIDDATGAQARLTNHTAAAVVSDRSEPELKSGIDGGRATASETASESP
jgi:TPR repeat protein